MKCIECNEGYVEFNERLKGLCESCRRKEAGLD